MTVRHQGGSFLFERINPADIVIPDTLGPEYKQIASTARAFVDRDVLPNLDAIERHDWSISRGLLRDAGDLGFVGIEMPVTYGGLGLDKTTATVIAEELGATASFAVTFMVHTGIGSLPIVYFGTPEQKQRYLPDLASGAKIAAYSLTETSSGSDALGAKTTARLTPDGTAYLLNGTKQWTSNAGFADVFIVFAKIDGERFTAFIVDRTTPGLSIGPEERKMGLHGSSTAQVILSDARVPVENVLHFAGRGHQVAFNMLNLGRLKLGAVCAGASRHLLGVSARYARERHQFGRPISAFALVRQKLAGMAVRTYATQSVVYRISGLLDDGLVALDLDGDVRESCVPALAEYAVECSIAKVHASETLDAVADEAVQVHGGYGFMAGFAAERAYRDNRINRIFEGTNEINRLLIPQTTARRLKKGDYGDRVSAFRCARRDGPTASGANLLDPEWAIVDFARLAFWDLLDAASKQFPEGLDDEQEILSSAADVAIEIISMESALARAARAQVEPPDISSLHADLAQSYVADARRRVATSIERTAAYLVGRGPDRAREFGQTHVDRGVAFDEIGAGRRIATRILEAEGWPLDN